MNEKEIEEKTARIVRMLRAQKLDGLLINAQHNFAWLTAGARNGIDLSRENGAAYLLVDADGKRYVLASRIEMPRILTEEISKDLFEPIEFSWQDEKSAADLVVKTAASLTIGGRIATDIQVHPSAPSIEGTLSACRYRLTQQEIERYRSLGRETGEALGRVAAGIAPGETEIEIAEKLRHELAMIGAVSIVTLVAADERIANFRHPVPTENRWRKTVMLVTCAKRHGLIASVTRMLSVGNVPDDLAGNTEATAFVNAKLLSKCRDGATAGQLYEAAAGAYAERGFADEIDKHHQGGAIGYRSREWVARPGGMDTVVTPLAFAWNPSVTGTKVEETCIISGDQTEILTLTPGFPQIVTRVDVKEYVSTGILSV